MARNAAWRRTISDLVSWRQDQALNATIYILREMGPTGFLLKEEGESKKFKAFLGDPHKCTCSTFMKDKDLCKHICWLLLKKFRIPRTNPVTWQMGLVEREINELLRGLMAHQDPRRGPPAKKVTATTTVVDGRPVLEQREIGKEDVCPICQEELLAKHEPVTYCKFGCANSIHIKCMKVWAEHQKSSGETVIKCPFCREDFGPFDLLRQEYANSSVRQTRAERLDLHLGSVCGGCRVCPIQGKCYNCTVCVTYYLCQECFNTQIHTEHSFQFRQKPTQRWRPAQRGSGTALPSAVVNNLMNREIREEDYDMLLQLDSTAANQVSNIPEEVVKGFPTERVRDGSKLLAPGEQCRVCLRAFQAGQQIRRLPVCKHKFHIDCIDNWLIHQRPTCPIDGQVVWSPLMAEMEEQEKERKRQRKKEEANARAEQQEQQANGLVLEIPGVGLIRRGSTGSLGSLSTNKNLKPKTAAYNSIPLNFALTGTGLNSPQSEPSSPSNVSSPTQLLSRVRINRRLVPSDVRTQQVTPSVPSIPLPRNLNNNDVGAAAAISTNSPVNRGWRPSSITSSPGAGGRKPPSGRNSSGGVRNESGFDSGM
ncbi:E3 ubiquitin-protein ligase ZSWIM2-like isoform X2 [Lingula anatina]|uniref:E3 ubiquitin-protein ligase ZSWIM2-like isoform X2 n=1 Tax=Lingula anatina TaxID=7574 RepID=A0A1S3JZY7_LINAN|nr:E3 ubiquitin-protein ligase ZSWIM2-like isoform X2 [Lingula anatina]|eukprot:XP_013415948.1 E3 ubiquitin-protein ligase ZSWIM2-like isoform X2 [Lingula anatina]